MLKKKTRVSSGNLTNQQPMIWLWDEKKNFKRMTYVAPDIAAALKFYISWKEWISGILFFVGERYCLRIHHLVLWLLGTLTGQQRFYGSGLVT